MLREIPISEIDNIKTGQAQNDEAGTGCTGICSKDAQGSSMENPK